MGCGWGGLAEEDEHEEPEEGVEESGKERAGEVVEDRYAPRQLD